jgi:hypothetical protein
MTLEERRVEQLLDLAQAAKHGGMVDPESRRRRGKAAGLRRDPDGMRLALVEADPSRSYRAAPAHS